MKVICDLFGENHKDLNKVVHTLNAKKRSNLCFFFFFSFFSGIFYKWCFFIYPTLFKENLCQCNMVTANQLSRVLLLSWCHVLTGIFSTLLGSPDRKICHSPPWSEVSSDLPVTVWCMLHTLEECSLYIYFCLT